MVVRLVCSEASQTSKAGRTWLRSQGVLNPDALAEARRTGVPLSFDPLQGGWVFSECLDDLSLETPVPRYRFRRWTLSDAEDLARVLSSEALWRYLPETGSGGAVDVPAARALIEISNTSRHHIVRAVEFKGIVIGQVRLVTGNSDAEISYWLDPAHWGRGHASRIIGQFTQASFADAPGLMSIYAKIHVGNSASLKVISRCGFVENPGRRSGVWRFFELPRPAGD